MLKIDIESAPSGVKLVCSGRLVLGVEAETLRCMATDRYEHHLVLDLSRVRVVDAAGLGLLVELHQWAHGHGRRLTIANPSPSTQRVMALTSLDRVLNLCGSLSHTAELTPCDEWLTMTA